MSKTAFYPASRFKASLYLAGSLFFVAAAWYSDNLETFIAWSSIVFFGLCAIASALLFLPGFAYISLDEAGVEVASPLRRKFKFKWSEVNAFYVASERGAKSIAVTYNRQTAASLKKRSFTYKLFGVDAFIANVYAGSIDGICSTLNAWRQRYGHQSI